MRGGGEMASIIAAIGNNVPCTSRSAVAGFFARMKVVVRWQGGGCNDEGNSNDGGDVVKLAATRAGVE
jgi:hypothetical protein